MSHTDLRAIIDAPPATGADAATTEPSHIHIPRPSRVGRPSVRHLDDEAPVPVQLELALDAAA